MFRSIAAVVVGMFWFATAVSDAAEADYPRDYRSWQHVKSMIIQPGHPLEDPFGGIHHVYANPQAMAGLGDSRFEPGAVLVFDLLDYQEGGQTLTEGERKRIDVMQYDPERFADTAGWGYSTFSGENGDSDQRLVQDVVTACHQCHVGAQATGYVFSRYRE